MTTDPASPRRPFEPSDLYRLRSVAEVALRPVGDVVAQVVTWPDRETDTNRAVLHSCRIDGSDHRRLTEGHRDTGPRWSPDGSRLAFLRSAPEAPTRVMLLNWPDGELTEVAGFPDGAVELAWGGERLFVRAPRRPDDQVDVDDEELARRPRIVDRLDYRFNGRGWIHDRPVQVFVIDDPGPGATPREIGLPGIDHGAMAPSPDGRRVAVAAGTDSDRDLTGSNDVWVIDVADEPGPDREANRITPEGGFWVSVVWHPDDVVLATGGTDRLRAGFQHPYRLGDPTPGSPPRAERMADADQHVVPGFAGGRPIPLADGVLYPRARRGRLGLDVYHFDGTVSTIHEDDHQVVAADATFDRTVVVGAVTSVQRPAELWSLHDRARPILTLNDGVLAELDLAEVEEVEARSADGTEVHGFLVRPPASAPGPEGGPEAEAAGRPGLVYVHGGPLAQYGLGFFDEFQIAAALGYVVIGGNPRGADGYGEDWATAIVGDLGNLDWQDVRALTDHLADQPDVDPERIGIGGGSYGGLMTAWALAHDPQRYRAGLVERAVTSWTTMFGTSDIAGWFTRALLGATVEDDPVAVRRQSPLEYATSVEAPTLIVHSEQDWRCPIEQAEQYFAALRRNGVDATLVRFPGENHELTRSGKPSHRIERFEIVHEFFARHLGGADFDTEHLPPPQR